MIHNRRPEPLQGLRERLVEGAGAVRAYLDPSKPWFDWWAARHALLLSRSRLTRDPWKRDLRWLATAPTLAKAMAHNEQDWAIGHGPRPRSSQIPDQYPFLWVPGLTGRPFWDTSQFSWTQTLESHTATILEEFTAYNMRHGVGSYVPPEEGGDLALDFWKTLHFVGPYGRHHVDTIAQFPKTMAVLRNIPRIELRNMCMFSAFTPHHGVSAHTGWSNLFLRCHLTLVNPEPDRITLHVGCEQAHWQEGRVLVFDDSYWHSVENHSSQVRVVLFFDIWHPDLSDDEVSKLQAAYADFRDRNFPGHLRGPDAAPNKTVLEI